MSSSDSEVDFNEINVWNPNKFCKKPEKLSNNKTQLLSDISTDEKHQFRKSSSCLQHKRLDHLKEQIQKQIEIDKRFEQRREWRKNRRLMNKLRQDPAIQKAVKEETGENKETECNSEVQDNPGESWKEIKSYLSVNDHLIGPVSHGKYGPKTELESIIDNCIDKGDFDAAELLSDHLSNREFGAKIAHAFAAKRYAENKAKEDAIQKAKKLKKLNWGFEPKERWEMKGNM